jgi:N-methylhydantoinase B
MPPAEILEGASPILFTQWALREGSAGPGRHRGGFGAIYEIEALEDGTSAFLLGERGRFAPFGVAGGENAALNRFVWQSDDGEQSPPMASKVTDVKLRKGQRVRLETPGGGGWGSPFSRDPERVARDVRQSLITAQDAVKDYGVVLAADGTVDLAATKEARA